MTRIKFLENLISAKSLCVTDGRTAGLSFVRLLLQFYQHNCAEHNDT